MRAYLCDGCGKEMDYPRVYKIRVKKKWRGVFEDGFFSSQWIEKDLCQECQDKIDKILKGDIKL